MIIHGKFCIENDKQNKIRKDASKFTTQTVNVKITTVVSGENKTF